MIKNSNSYQYYVDNDQAVAQHYQNFYEQSITQNLSYWSEGDTDMRFIAGDQQIYNDLYGNLPSFNRRTFNFNRILRIRNMITGYQRRNRKTSLVVPIEGSDEETADQFSKVLFYANQNSAALECISNSFEGAINTGMNLISVYMDYRSDPVNGDIKCDTLSYNSFLIDPFFTKADLSDCRGISTRRWVTKQEAMSLLPEQKEIIQNLPTSNKNQDGKYQFQPQNYNYTYDNLLTYDEYWYMSQRTAKMVVDVNTGDSIEWAGNEENLKYYLNQFKQLTMVEVSVPSVRLAILVQGRVLYHGPNPMGSDMYPFVPVLAYYYPEIPYFPLRVQGVVRGLRDAQYLYNRRRIIELQILESQINSGIKFKENALVNPKDAFLSGTGRSLAIKQEASMEDVQQIPAPQVPPSMIQLSELLAKEVMEISGVNEELLGTAQDDKAGILSMLRQGAGLTTLQKIFDQLDHSQMLLGKIYIDLIQKNWTPGKIKRIINQEPSDQFYTRAFQKYDMELEEGVYSNTQKQVRFNQLVELRNLGFEVPVQEFIDSLQIQGKKQLKDALLQQQEITQLQQQAQQQALEQQIQYDSALKEAEIRKKNAEVLADEGLGKERLARIEENRALAIERLAEAEKDRSMGVYNEIKAAKELNDIDLMQLQKFLEIIKSLRDLQEAESYSDYKNVEKADEEYNSLGTNYKSTQPSIENERENILESLNVE